MQQYFSAYHVIDIVHLYLFARNEASYCLMDLPLDVTLTHMVRLVLMHTP